MNLRKIFLLFSIIFLQDKFALAAVLGIDLGSEFVKAALVAPGSPFKIILDEHSKRKSPSLVVFDSDNRLFGNNGHALSLRKPLSSISFQLLLLGQTFDSPLMNTYNSRYFGHKLIEDDERGSIRIKFDTKILHPSDHTFDSISVEELMAMTLQYIARLAGKETGSNVKDTVITVPS